MTIPPLFCVCLFVFFFFPFFCGLLCTRLHLHKVANAVCDWTQKSACYTTFVKGDINKRTMLFNIIRQQHFTSIQLSINLYKSFRFWGDPLLIISYMQLNIFSYYWNVAHLLGCMLWNYSQTSIYVLLYINTFDLRIFLCITLSTTHIWYTRTLLILLKFNIRTLLNVLEFNICTLSTLSKVCVSYLSTLSKVCISNLSTYLE
jgi:hypothetical protein